MAGGGPDLLSGGVPGAGPCALEVVSIPEKKAYGRPMFEQRSRTSLWTLLEHGGGLAFFCLDVALANLLARSLLPALRDILVDFGYRRRPSPSEQIVTEARRAGECRRERLIPPPHGGAASQEARRSLTMPYEYKRRRPSIIRNFWVYRRLIGTAILLGLMLWFISVNHDVVTA